MAIHTLTFDAGLVRAEEGVSSVSIGDAGSTFEVLRYVINARSTYDAAVALANGVRGNTAFYGELGLSEATVKNVPRDSIAPLCFWRADFLVIGDTEVFNLALIEDNLGKPLTSSTAYQKALRCMQTAKWKLTDRKKSLRLEVSA